MMTDKVRRTPQGVRGLKWDIVEIMHSLYRSHPARGAWIEMLEYDVPSARPRRTPQGVRGLKSGSTGGALPPERSHPARGAWIEISPSRRTRPTRWSHPARGAWIEIATASFQPRQ